MWSYSLGNYICEHIHEFQPMCDLQLHVHSNLGLYSLKKAYPVHSLALSIILQQISCACMHPSSTKMASKRSFPQVFALLRAVNLFLLQMTAGLTCFSITEFPVSSCINWPFHEGANPQPLLVLVSEQGGHSIVPQCRCVRSLTQAAVPHPFTLILRKVDKEILISKINALCDKNIKRY